MHHIWAGNSKKIGLECDPNPVGPTKALLDYTQEYVVPKQSLHLKLQGFWRRQI